MDCMSAGKTNIVTRSIHISTEFQEHMDRMSASKAYRLFWLGRYYERVATTLTYLWSWYDRIIDGESPDYAVFCNALDISCNYETAEEFMQIIQKSHHAARKALSKISEYTAATYTE